MNWYPMTSAPMDGACVWLLASGEMIAAEWVHCYGWIDGRSCLVTKPTAWTPL